MVAAAKALAAAAMVLAIAGCAGIARREAIGQNTMQQTPAHLAAIESTADVATTVAALKAAFAARGITVFALIDHAAAAADAGQAMPRTQVIVFGNPKAGTPLMQAHPDLALDLPMRVLVRETVPGRAELRWHSSADIEHGQRLPVGTLDGLKPLDALIRQTVARLGTG
ncbi:MAG: DUF302 domain-containing protein [Pseudomonadota bacterium]|nr:DUF302 domain-containing protein [Pseudomonadota bacterium]